MHLLYVNDLRSLPNFGCRTTGVALEEMLKKQHDITRRDGIETIYNSGWDSFSRHYYRIGGVIPDRLFGYCWRRRYSRPTLYNQVCKFDAKANALHDYVCQNVEQSLERFHRFKRKYRDLAEFEAQVAEADGIVINGEGTLIFANPTRRDALYLLFVIAFARSVGKPVFLLNAMITQCPYSGADEAVLKQASELLKYCSIIACREAESCAFTEALVGSSSLRLVPDALFTWGERFRQAALAIKMLPELCSPFGSAFACSGLNFKDRYVCVSASSSVWRDRDKAATSFIRLATALKATGLRVYFISTCAGDSLLSAAAREANVTHIPENISVLAGAGIIAGASVYVTGRYHPAIMAAAGGVPTVFMSSNSHKTRTVQHLLGYDSPREFSVTPSPMEISAIVSEVSAMVTARETIAKTIRTNFELQAERAREFETIISC